MNSQLNFNIKGNNPAGASTGESWIKLTLDPPEQTSEVTKTQLADWLDAAYGIQNHCTGEVSDTAYDPTDPADTTEQRLQSALSGNNCYEAADLLAMQDKCSLTHRAGISKKYKVYVHCISDIVRDRYKFTCTSDISPSGPTRGEKTIKIIIDFTDAKECPVYRYAELEDINELWKRQGYGPQWLGDVLIGTRKISSSNIGIGWSNGRIVLSEQVSGRLVIYLPIKYDIWEVSVPGIVIGNARNYTAEAYAFDESLDEPASIELTDEQDNEEEGSNCTLCDGNPDPLDPSEFSVDPVTGDLTGVTSSGGQSCQKRIDWEVRNSCSGDLVSSGTRYEECPCPDQRVRQITYTMQGTSDSDKYSAAEFEYDCCYPPPESGCLPCKKITSNYNGGAPVLPSEQYWLDKYAPAKVIFNRIRPDGGCGSRVDTFSSDNGNCCNDYYIMVSIVNNKLVFSGAVDWEYFASVNNSNPVTLSPPVRVDLESCGSLVAMGYEEASGITRSWQFAYTIYKGAEVIKTVNVSGPGDPGRPPNEVYLVFTDTVEISP